MVDAPGVIVQFGDSADPLQDLVERVDAIENQLETLDAEAVTMADGYSVQSNFNIISSRDKIRLSRLNLTPGAFITAAVQGAINAMPPAGGEIFLPGGLMKMGAVNTNGKPIVFQGDGRGQTFIEAATATTNLFTHSGQECVEFHDFTISGPLMQTAGAYITIDGPVGQFCFSPKIENMRFYNAYVGVDFKSCVDYRVENCTFIGHAGSYAGVRTHNTLNGDVGDGFINSCLFTGPGGAGVLQHSSGGLKIIGTKFNGLVRGYAMELAMPTGGTSILLVSACSFENQSDCGMDFLRASGTGRFDYVNICGSEFAYAPTAIRVRDNGAVFRNWLIGQNQFVVVSGGIGIDIDGSNTIAMPTNQFVSDTTGTAIKIGANSLNARIGPQIYANVATQVNNAGTGTVIAASW